MGRIGWVWRSGVAVSLALTLVGPVSAQPADGLIVKLKDAPAHQRMAALSASRRAAESNRAQRVLLATRMTEVRPRPAGRAAQHFDFGRRLSATEAQSLAGQLRAQPEVEWVEPNVRERLLQAAPAPNDTYFPFLAAN